MVLERMQMLPFAYDEIQEKNSSQDFDSDSNENIIKATLFIMQMFLGSRFYFQITSNDVRVK